MEITPTLRYKVMVATGLDSIFYTNKLISDTLSQIGPDDGLEENDLIDFCKMYNEEMIDYKVRCLTCNKVYKTVQLKKYNPCYTRTEDDCPECHQKQYEEKYAEYQKLLNEQMSHFDVCVLCEKLEKCKDCKFPFCSQCNIIKEPCEGCPELTYHAMFNRLKQLDKEIKEWK